MHPVAFMMVVGIVFQGLAETFISPRFLEYFSLQAPKGEEGLYLGFSHLHSFLSSILGFGLSGYLLSKYCPDESLFATRSEWLAASSNAHYIWYYFAVIALASAIALIIYGQVVKAPRSGKSIKITASVVKSVKFVKSMAFGGYFINFTDSQFYKLSPSFFRF